MAGIILLARILMVGGRRDEWSETLNTAANRRPQRRHPIRPASIHTNQSCDWRGVVAHNDNSVTFATIQLLKAEREKRGISLKKLATRTGIEEPTLAELKTDINSNRTPPTLLRIARALGGTLECVFCDVA